jgi:acyl-CoA reductase-like NAD-dependent aldehyde dehydrogenase
MSNDNPQSQDQSSQYAFQGRLPTEELLEIARIHHKEAKELLEHAQEAKAEEREEEAKLLMDLSVAREERAQEFEKAAKGEGGDPIVTEILDWQEDLCGNYTPHSLEFFTEEELASSKLPDELESPPLGRIARFLAWFGSWGH